MNLLLVETKLPSGQTLQLIKGDITVEKTDAVVNAANEVLKHGAGVAAAILQRGGPIIEEESDAWVKLHGPVKHNAPAWTSGGNLACRFVIHAVGPIWGETQGENSAVQKDAELAEAVKGSLQVADRLGLASIAFPAISTGIFGFPEERAAGVLYRTIREYFGEPSGLKLVRLVLYQASTAGIFERVWHDHFSPKSQT